MNEDINRVELRGRLTQNPVLRNLADGRAVANVGLATNRWTAGSNGERRELTEYTNLVLWEALAKQVMRERLSKGDPLHIRGRLQTRAWEGKDGQQRRTTEVVVDQIVPVEGRRTPLTPAALDEDLE